MKHIAITLAATVAGVGLGYVLFGGTAAANPEAPVKLIQFSGDLLDESRWRGLVTGGTVNMARCQAAIHQAEEDSAKEGPSEEFPGAIGLIACVPMDQPEMEFFDVHLTN